MSEDSIRADVTGAGLRVRRRERLVVFEHAIVEGVGDEKISGSVYRQSCGPACSGCAWRRRRGRARAGVGGEGDPARALAEDAVGSGIARAGCDVRRRERLIEFEHARVVYIGDVEISGSVARESARAA